MERPKYLILSLIRSLKSLIKDGRTLRQKRKYIQEKHPILYHYLFEEDQATGDEILKV